jgi:ABC-2 type transport system permease protein
MSQVFAIVWQDLRIFLSRRSNLPSLVLVPVVMTVLIGLVSGGAFNSSPVQLLDVIDRDSTQATEQFLTSIRQADTSLILCPMDNTGNDICSLGNATTITEAHALDRVAKGSSTALLVIPAGFGASLSAQQPATMTFSSTGDFGDAQSVKQAVQAALSQLNAASTASQLGMIAIQQLQEQPLAADQSQIIQDSLYQQALLMEKTQHASVEFSLSGSSQKPTTGESLQYGLGQSVPGMGSMFVLMTIFGAMATLIIERQQYTLQRLATMPISRSQLLAGKILARFCLGLLQFLVVFIVGALLGMNFGKDPLALVLLTIVYILAVTAISFAIGSGLKNAAQAAGLSLLLTLTLAPIGGAWWPMEISPKFLQTVGHISPVAWAMDGFTALTYNGAHLGEILVPLAVLLGIMVVAFLIAIPRFRYQVD